MSLRQEYAAYANCITHSCFVRVPFFTQILGFGASLLWTSQGRLILAYSNKAEEKASLLGLFWAIFQCSSVIGGTLTFLYYSSNKAEGSATLYVVFGICLLIGAFCTQLLLPPSMLEDTTKRQDVEMISEHTPLTVDSDAQYTRGESQIMTDDITWLQETQGTVEMFTNKRMMCLFLLFFYTGFNQPYQQATFGNRFFNRRTIGVQLIVFHLMEIASAVLVGRLLDQTISNRRTRAVQCLAVFIVVNGLGNVLAAAQEYSAKRAGSPSAHDILDIGVVSPSLAFACWGFADAQIQVYCYWLIGGLYKSGSDHARAVGFYKMAQSLGTSVGFFLIPTSRLSGISQLSCSSLVFAVGILLSFSQLPRQQSCEQKDTHSSIY